MIGMVMVALAQQAAVPATPTLLAAKMRLEGRFSCSVRGFNGRSLDLSGVIARFEDRLDELDRVSFQIKGPNGSGLGGMYHGRRDFDKFSLANFQDENGEFVKGVERPAQLHFWLPLGNPNGIMSVVAENQKGVEFETEVLTGLCDVNFKEDIEY